MGFARRLRDVASKVFRRAPSNDNDPFKILVSAGEEAPLKIIITPKENARALNPPLDNGVVETLHGVEVSDPFRPLENIASQETTGWVARQNARFEDFILPARGVLEKTVSFLENAAPKGLRETMPGRYGDIYVSQRKNEDDARWVYCVKDVPDYGAPARVLLDPLRIDPSGKTEISGAYFTRDGKTVAYGLSVSGSDEITLHFMDVATGQDLGLVYPKFRGGITWDRDGQGFCYNWSVDGLSKASGVRHHKMGTDPKEDIVIYDPDQPETGAGFYWTLKDSKDEPGSHEWVNIRNTDRSKNRLLARPYGSKEDFREIFPHKEGTLYPLHEANGKIYAITTLGAPNQKLVAFDINDPAPEKWQTILAENKEDPLSGAFIWQNSIFATYSHDTGSVLKVFDLQGGFLHDVPLPPLSVFSLGNLRMEDKTCLIALSGFQESGNVYEYDSETNTLALHKKSTMPIDLKDCVVERLHATSKDGTQVPMTVIRHPDTALDGTAATLLYGYGGFNISLNPGFSSGVAEWVRAGGIYVQANLRGGGEYGQSWYDAGRGANKQNVFDDFIACAEYLIGEKYTSPERLAIQGGSNGGLLTAATALQRPDLFGSVISEVPVTDMFRFHIGSFYGYGWKSDYGDPGIKEDFNVAAKYSPLHNVKKGFRHPPILIKTDIHDDRVLPWHGFKMAAMLQAREGRDSKTYLNVRTDGGHGAGLAEAQRRADTGVVRAFLHQTLGPTNQNDYKTSLKKDGKVKKLLKKIGFG